MTSPATSHSYMDPEAHDHGPRYHQTHHSPEPVIFRERALSEAPRSQGLNRDHYNFNASSAQSWLIEPNLYEALPLPLQSYLMDVSKAGADTAASLERVHVAEAAANSVDIDDCYDLFGTDQLASLDRPEHRHVEQSEADEERYPCSPVLKSRSRSSSEACTMPPSATSSRSNSFKQSPIFGSERFPPLLSSPLRSLVRSPQIGGRSPCPIDIAAPWSSNSDQAIDLGLRLRSPSLVPSPVPSTSGLASPPFSGPNTNRPKNFSTTRFAHHLDLRTQTYVTEVHNFRKQSLPRLRHALTRLTNEWHNLKRQAYVKQRRVSSAGFEAEPLPDEQVAVEIHGRVVIDEQIDGEFEIWVREKSAIVVGLEEYSVETGMGMGVGCTWGSNGAVAWT